MDLWGDGPFLSYTRGKNMNKKKETTTQRKGRLEKAKLKRQEKIANESDVHKRQRLEKMGSGADIRHSASIHSATYKYNAQNSAALNCLRCNAEVQCFPTLLPSPPQDAFVTNLTAAEFHTFAARGRPIIVEWERDARHSAGLSRSVTHRYVTERYTFHK
ncbi:hypothetical protein EVAR_81807_1 [Eumeta japonica]|uniref:Uncharacterized protein n=1 Tax=Eumeta variegata TaxID=151549 RepID=A0A4C1UIX0_EUMVA|nr:hypothetical protein EVAR_81807_1 [Eumeta japonica]